MNYQFIGGTNFMNERCLKKPRSKTLKIGGDYKLSHTSTSTREQCPEHAFECLCSASCLKICGDTQSAQ